MENHFYQAFDFEQFDKAAKVAADDYRSPFQIDRDRIIHTSAFRRLQNKTQVFVSGEYDFYRTRLTHSIEVAQIGRSLCSRLQKTSPFLKDDFHIDADLVEAACLAHDIGHPPFGHTGERTLHRLMEPYGGFEGNAQTLRILTRTIFGSDRGMNPTRALIDGVLKYKTLFGEVEDLKNHFVYREQEEWLRFVRNEKEFPEEYPPGKKRDAFRSIECQIMDWADDTAYSLNDIADGVHAGFVTAGKIENWAASQTLTSVEKPLVDELLAAIRKDRIEPRLGKKIGEFIAAASLVETDGFLSDLSNRHRYRLMVDPEIAGACSLYKKMAFSLVFRSQQLQQLDRKSDFILTRLFDVLADHYIHTGGRKPNHFQLLSDVEEEQIFATDCQNERARIVCDFLAKMTDSVASRTYKRLFDADFGSIVDLL